MSHISVRIKSEEEANAWVDTITRFATVDEFSVSVGDRDGARILGNVLAMRGFLVSLSTEGAHLDVIKLD
jgi:hypothetical protein